MKCIPAFDQGTISSRVILFNEGGNRLEWPLSGVLLNAYNRQEPDVQDCLPIRILLFILYFLFLINLRTQYTGSGFPMPKGTYPLRRVVLQYD